MQKSSYSKHKIRKYSDFSILKFGLKYTFVAEFIKMKQLIHQKE